MSVANTYIKPSPIHGLGLFAARVIAAGEEVVQGGPDYSFNDEWRRYLKTARRPSMTFERGYCMVNHAAVPNTRRGADGAIIAARHIAAGEEITEDYHALPPAQNPFVNNVEEVLYLAAQDRKRSR